MNIQPTIKQEQTDKSEQIYKILCEIAEYRRITGNGIDIDEFEKSRQDRELDR